MEEEIRQVCPVILTRRKNYGIQDKALHETLH
jgi:hypothetical protein